MRMFLLYLMLTVMAWFSPEALAQTALGAGWNLIGNGSATSLDVSDPTLFGDPARVASVWKWLPTGGKWAIYAPSLTSQELGDFAMGRGHDVLTAVAGGEGFWVNAKTPFSVSLPDGPVVLASPLLAGLQPGWSLVATGETKSPGDFEITTLWAWDSAQSKWYFYSPSLSTSAALGEHIQSKGYLDFAASNKKLGPGVGFWVNKPATSTRCGPIPAITSPTIFTASPIDPETIRWISPMGNLNPPSHMLPTDHIYFYFANPDASESPLARRTDFFAPGEGTVTSVISNSSTWADRKILVRVSETLTYFIDHVIPEIPIVPGTKLVAGQRLGTTGSVYAVDLGVINSALALGFVNPSRYNSGVSLNADGPLKYYDEPLRNQLYSKVQRTGPDCDGKIDYDIAGRLSGNWFARYSPELVPQMSFAYDTYDPSQVRISVPSVLTLPGVHAIASTDPLPRDVSVASGKVLYTITPSRTGLPIQEIPAGRLLVQMLSDTHIRVETFSLSASATDFTGNAREYVR